MTWMRETRIRMFMQMELEACRDEFDWLMIASIGQSTIIQEYCPPMPLLVPADNHKSWGKRTEIAAKGILPPTLQMILKTRCPLLDQPPIPPPPDILPSPSPLPS